MKRKVLALLLVFSMMGTLSACGEDEETTVTGMVVSIDGTVISIVEMDMASMGTGDRQQMERPDDMEGFEGFDGTLPEGETFPQGEGMMEMPDGERPQRPDGEMQQMPENGEMPELPEGETMPQMADGEMGQMPENGGMQELPSGGDGSMMPGLGEDMETTEIDIADAHISIEIDDGKATGSLEDITVGTMVTVTLNAKGKATNVLVSSQSAMGGFGGKGQKTMPEAN